MIHSGLQTPHSELRVLLVTEGSGGHLIPALEVAGALRRAGATVKLWYAQHQQLSRLIGALVKRMADAGIETTPLPIDPSGDPLERLWRCGQLWREAERCFAAFEPDVVVGFGGWMSAPVVLAARCHRISCLLHEQNVVLGRANRWLAPRVHRLAVSFQETRDALKRPSAVVTGMPVRPEIGRSSRREAAEQFGFDWQRPTLLVLGGSQGAWRVNQLMIEAACVLSEEDRRTWQILHVTGHADEARVREAYTSGGVASWVAPFVVEMDAAYALADVAIARAGASTVAELARCGLPAVLIPYPHAGGHQRANANVVEAVGGGLVIDESEATPKRVLSAVHRILRDTRLRRMMSAQIRTLDVPDAAERLAQVIVGAAQGDHGSP